MKKTTVFTNNPPITQSEKLNVYANMDNITHSENGSTAKFLAKFGRCPKAGTGVHDYENHVVVTLLARGHPEKQVRSIVRKLTAGCGRSTEQDINESIKTAHKNLGLGKGSNGVRSKNSLLPKI